MAPPAKPYTLTYRNPALASASEVYVENFEDKYGRLARASGPFNYISLVNLDLAATLTVELNQDPDRPIYLAPGQAYADNVEPYSSLRVRTSAAVAASQLVIQPKRNLTPGTTVRGV